MKLGKTKEKGGKTKVKKMVKQKKKANKNTGRCGLPVRRWAALIVAIYLTCQRALGKRQKKRKEHNNSFISRSQFVNYHDIKTLKDN